MSMIVPKVIQALARQHVSTMLEVNSWRTVLGNKYALVVYVRANKIERRIVSNHTMIEMI